MNEFYLLVAVSFVFSAANLNHVEVIHHQGKTLIFSWSRPAVNCQAGVILGRRAGGGPLLSREKPIGFVYTLNR